jgi:hypothetical protein
MIPSIGLRLGAVDWIGIGGIVELARRVAEICRLRSVQDWLSVHVCEWVVVCELTLNNSSIERPNMYHTIRTTLSDVTLAVIGIDLPSRVDITLTRGFSRAEMTSNQSLQNLMTSISHDRTVLGMSESLASRGRVTHASI